MDQTAILTTLLGGMLAIVGGFLGTYFTQIITSKTETKKFAREKTEELYSLINDLDDRASQQFVKIGILVQTDGEYDKIVECSGELLREGNTYANKIEMISNLYIKSMKDDAKNYADKVRSIFSRIYLDIINKRTSELILIITKDSEDMTLLNTQFKRKVVELIDNLQ